MYALRSLRILAFLWLSSLVGGMNAPASNTENINTALDFVRSSLLQTGSGNLVAHPCSLACSTLRLLLGSKVHGPDSTFYESQQYTYWSNQQAEINPTCYIEPSSSRDISNILLVAQATNCSFAVRSGGHACFAGASNIEEGITVSLKGFDRLEVSNDRTTTYTGPGNTWGQVYEKLTPMNLSAIGGRGAGLGVGGVTLGGGISFYSGRHGWACDNVRNYEVVIANGQTLSVNRTSYPDLYWALRGGGNQFGVVTQFDLVTFPQGDIWGGGPVYPITANVSLFNAYTNFVYNLSSDPSASLFIAFVMVNGSYVATAEYIYGKPIANPPIYREFLEIPSLVSKLSIHKLPGVANAINNSNPAGFRELYRTATFGIDTRLLVEILDIFVAEIDPVKSAEGLRPVLLIQPISEPDVVHMSKRGGNALGLSVTEAPFTLMSLALMWSDREDDARITAASKRIISRAISTAGKKGLHNKYIYQNYAAKDQDVFAGYGPANLARLIKISQKYDPCGVFQKLQPGYFKLPRAANGELC